MDYKFIRFADITGCYVYTKSSQYLTLEQVAFAKMSTEFDYLIHFDGKFVQVSKETYDKVSVCLGTTWP
jgi:hypothetical protein